MRATEFECRQRFWFVGGIFMWMFSTSVIMFVITLKMLAFYIVKGVGFWLPAIGSSRIASVGRNRRNLPPLPDCRPRETRYESSVP